MRAAMGEPGLLAESEGLESLRRAFGVPSFTPARFSSGERVEAYLGIDGGSTSTKAVLMDPDGAILAKSYRLSAGNPLDDTREILRELDEQVKSQGGLLAIRGVGTTGYARTCSRRRSWPTSPSWRRWPPSRRSTTIPTPT